MTKKAIKVLHFSPHDEDDGIAKYQEQYLNAMKSEQDLTNAFFSLTPLQLRHLPSAEQAKELDRLRHELAEYDILHIQHEFGLFAEDEFARIVSAGKSAGKKVVVSVHLSPGFAIKPVKLGGLGPRSWVRYLKEKRHLNRMLERHVKPFSQADLLLVHNDITAQSLKDFGIPNEKIQKLIHPVYVFPDPELSHTIAKKLNKKDGDIIFCTVGMLHRYKGVFDAVKALKYLPSNYKLAIIGGMHPLSDEVSIYNKICDLIDDKGLKDRVYITGFVKDDNEMNALIRECDVCVFPYDGTYYAHLSSGAINLAFSNHMPVIAYPTLGFKELAGDSDGAVVLTDTFAYYELARNLQQIDLDKQRQLSSNYAERMAWPKAATQLISFYRQLV